MRMSVVISHNIHMQNTGYMRIDQNTTLSIVSLVFGVILKRDVVFKVVGGWCRLGWRRCVADGGFGCATAVEHLHFFGDDFGGVFVLPFFVLPFAGA